MNQATVPAEERFAALVETFLGQPGVTHASDDASGVMKEWLSLEPGSNEDWLALAREAMDFVAGTR